jgi:hypothetical protein
MKYDFMFFPFFSFFIKKYCYFNSNNFFFFLVGEGGGWYSYNWLTRRGFDYFNQISEGSRFQ